jgi:predicted ribonuclease YlaK
VGKSVIAVGTANLLVQYGFYSGIVYVMFPTMEQRLGYLPGTLEEKAAPYMQALCDACYTLGIDPNQAILSEDNVQAMKEGKAYIQFTTDTFMRGINIENKVVIVDEAANGYLDELKKVLTRIHDSCKLVLIGHSGQCDLVKKPERSGFVPYIEAFRKAIEQGETRAQICELTQNHRGWISSFCDNVYFDQ